MLNASGFKELFTNGVLHIYAGPQPINADSGVQGVLLGKVTVGAGAFTPGTATNGLNFGAPTGGVIAKAAGEVWQMVGIAAGTAGWFRLMGNPVDDLASSTTLSRMDGSIANSGGDLNLSTVTVAIGTPITIDIFQFTLPQS
jgi:hypothetical protein